MAISTTNRTAEYKGRKYRLLWMGSRNIIADIIRRAEIGDGQDMPLVRGTYWAAYNGITEHLGRSRGHDRDSRLNSVWFGSSAEMSRRALELALSMAS